jgi:tetratricopeptide (TPR) repeat protein
MAASFGEHLEHGEKALARFDNAEALAAFEAALQRATRPHERALALDGIATIRFRHKEDEQALALLEQAAAACMPNGETPADAQTACALAQVWYDKCYTLMTLDRGEDAIDVCDQSLSRFLDRVTAVAPAGNDWRKLRRTIAKTMAMKGSVLLALDRMQESLACNEEAMRRFRDIDDLGVQRSVARAMRQRAWLFGQLGRLDKKVEAYDELFARFGASTDSQIGETVLTGLEDKMQIYRDQEDFETVIEICDQIIGRYRADSYWPIADTVARTMVRQAVAFGRRGARGKELAAYDTVVRLYGDSPDPTLRLHGAKALMFKAVTLSDADEVSAEMECYDEVVRRYAEDADREVRVVAADALIHKGISLGAIAEDAAEDTGVREVDSEIACYDEVARRYGAEETLVLKRAVAEALLHKAETLLDVGRNGEASVCLDALIGGCAAIQDEELAEIVKDARELRAEA